jgi:hypothetical protein
MAMLTIAAEVRSFAVNYGVAFFGEGMTWPEVAVVDIRSSVF